MGIDKVCDEARVFVDLLSAHAECVQLVKQCPPRRINVLCLKANVRIPTNMSDMAKVRGHPDP